MISQRFLEIWEINGAGPLDMREHSRAPLSRCPPRGRRGAPGAYARGGYWWATWGRGRAFGCFGARVFEAFEREFVFFVLREQEQLFPP